MTARYIIDKQHPTTKAWLPAIVVVSSSCAAAIEYAKREFPALANISLRARKAQD